ncbi:hypothetical protein COBT_003899, partial [Conglomerata obtusa]
MWKKREKQKELTINTPKQNRFYEGDMVMYKNMKRTNKLEHKWCGPFVIQASHGAVSHILTDANKSKTIIANEKDIKKIIKGTKTDQFFCAHEDLKEKNFNPVNHKSIKEKKIEKEEKKFENYKSSIFKLKNNKYDDENTLTTKSFSKQNIKQDNIFEDLKTGIDDNKIIRKRGRPKKIIHLEQLQHKNDENTDSKNLGENVEITNVENCEKIHNGKDGITEKNNNFDDKIKYIPKLKNQKLNKFTKKETLEELLKRRNAEDFLIKMENEVPRDVVHARTGEIDTEQRIK